AGEIGRDDVVFVRESWDQRPEHMAGGWEAVQQEQRGRSLWAGLSVEDFHSPDRLGPVVYALRFAYRDFAGRSNVGSFLCSDAGHNCLLWCLCDPLFAACPPI